MRAASRFLLPLEMFIGMYTLLWGLSGGGFFGKCQLYFALIAADHLAEWAVALTLSGGLMFIVAAIEWIFGRGWTRLPPKLGTANLDVLWMRVLQAMIQHAVWTARSYQLELEEALRRKLSSNQAIYWFVSIRATLAFASIGIWIAAVAVIVMTPVRDAFPIIYPAALAHVVVAVWIYAENLKVRYALDERISTSSLQFHR